ncbi:unnamed protein product [Sphagnum tenellum]
MVTFVRVARRNYRLDVTDTVQNDSPGSTAQILFQSEDGSTTGSNFYAWLLGSRSFRALVVQASVSDPREAVLVVPDFRVDAVDLAAQLVETGVCYPRSESLLQSVVDFLAIFGIHDLGIETFHGCESPASKAAAAWRRCSRRADNSSSQDWKARRKTRVLRHFPQLLESQH